MTIPSGALTARAGVDGNYLDAISELALKIRERDSDELNPAMLSDIAPVVGAVQDVTVVAPEDFTSEVKFVTEDGTRLADLDAGWIENNLSGVAVRAYAKSANERGLVAQVVWDETIANFRQARLYHDGEFTYEGLPIGRSTQQLYTLVNDTNEAAVVFATIPANSMGTTGRIRVTVHVLIKNNKGSSGTYNLTFYFGSKSVTIRSGRSITNSATQRTSEHHVIEIVNAGADNAQVITARSIGTSNVLPENLAPSTPEVWWTTAAVDTTANVDVKVNIDLSATDANFLAISSGSVEGPYSALGSGGI